LGLLRLLFVNFLESLIDLVFWNPELDFKKISLFEETELDAFFLITVFLFVTEREISLGISLICLGRSLALSRFSSLISIVFFLEFSKL
jgi:hypothetical protein